jgi:hypothetical protein
MIEIETKDWPINAWNEIILWCYKTFGPEKDGQWMWHDDYSLQISEVNLTLLILRWS